MVLVHMCIYKYICICTNSKILYIIVKSYKYHGRLMVVSLRSKTFCFHLCPILSYAWSLQAPLANGNSYLIFALL